MINTLICHQIKCSYISQLVHEKFLLQTIHFFQKLNLEELTLINHKPLIHYLSEKISDFNDAQYTTRLEFQDKIFDDLISNLERNRTHQSSVQAKKKIRSAQRTLNTKFKAEYLKMISQISGYKAEEHAKTDQEVRRQVNRLFGQKIKFPKARPPGSFSGKKGKGEGGDKGEGTGINPNSTMLSSVKDLELRMKSKGCQVDPPGSGDGDDIREIPSSTGAVRGLKKGHMTRFGLNQRKMKNLEIFKKSALDELNHDSDGDNLSEVTISEVPYTILNRKHCQKLQKNWEDYLKSSSPEDKTFAVQLIMKDIKQKIRSWPRWKPAKFGSKDSIFSKKFIKWLDLVNEKNKEIDYIVVLVYLSEQLTGNPNIGPAPSPLKIGQNNRRNTALELPAINTRTRTFLNKLNRLVEPDPINLHNPLRNLFDELNEGTGGNNAASLRGNLALYGENAALRHERDRVNQGTQAGPRVQNRRENEQGGENEDGHDNGIDNCIQIDELTNDFSHELERVDEANPVMVPPLNIGRYQFDSKNTRYFSLQNPVKVESLSASNNNIFGSGEMNEEPDDGNLGRGVLQRFRKSRKFERERLNSGDAMDPFIQELEQICKVGPDLGDLGAKKVSLVDVHPQEIQIEQDSMLCDFDSFSMEKPLKRDRRVGRDAGDGNRALEGLQRLEVSGEAKNNENPFEDELDDLDDILNEPMVMGLQQRPRGSNEGARDAGEGGDRVQEYFLRGEKPRVQELPIVVRGSVRKDNTNEDGLDVSMKGEFSDFDLDLDFN